MSTLPALLQHYMDQRGWSQYRLAQESGLSEPTISRLMSGKIKGQKAETILRLADTLGAPVTELLESAGHDKLAATYRMRGQGPDFQGFHDDELDDLMPPQEFEELRKKIRRREPAPTPENLAKLAKDPDLFTRMWVAENDNTPVEVLAELAKDKEWEVRSAVSYGRERVPREILNKLLGDRRREVFESARSALTWKEYSDMHRARVLPLDQVLDLVQRVAVLCQHKDELKELHPNDIEETLENLRILYDKLLCNHEAIQRFGFKRRKKGKGGKQDGAEQVQEAPSAYNERRAAREMRLAEFEQLCRELNYTEISRSQFKNMTDDAQRQVLELLERKQQEDVTTYELLRQMLEAS